VDAVAAADVAGGESVATDDEGEMALLPAGQLLAGQVCALPLLYELDEAGALIEYEVAVDDWIEALVGYVGPVEDNQINFKLILLDKLLELIDWTIMYRHKRQVNPEQVWNNTLTINSRGKKSDRNITIIYTQRKVTFLDKWKGDRDTADLGNRNEIFTIGKSRKNGLSSSSSRVFFFSLPVNDMCVELPLRFEVSGC
jgi:hypothetical protein